MCSTSKYSISHSLSTLLSLQITSECSLWYAARKSEKVLVFLRQRFTDMSTFSLLPFRPLLEYDVYRKKTLNFYLMMHCDCFFVWDVIEFFSFGLTLNWLCISLEIRIEIDFSFDWKSLHVNQYLVAIVSCETYLFFFFWGKCDTYLFICNLWVSLSRNLSSFVYDSLIALDLKQFVCE